MAIFTAIAATVSAAVGGGIFGAIAGFAARTLLTIGITKLIGNRAGTNAAGTQDSGARIQLPPASNNKVPVVYGTAYVAPIVTDAKISEDQRTMWYVCTLAEVTDTGSYTFGDIYWEGKKVIFDGTDTSKVIQLETNSDPVQIDGKINGQLYMWKFPNGSSSGISTGGADAIALLSDASIPADLQWDSALYTTGGQSAQMSNLAFIVVKVIYNDNAGTTSLKQMNVELTNSLYEPGSVIKDYLENVRYGCAIPIAQIDTASLDALDVYSAEQITYTPVGGGSATQDRYTINGPINTGQNCLTNLQQLVDDCDSWLQYNELTGQWKVVINKAYDGVIGDLYQVTDSNLMSGINVNPIDLNSAYNILEVQYPNGAVKDQTDYATFKLVDYAPEVMSPNEPENILTVQYGQVNNYIQSVYLGQRRLLQSREDLVIDFALDYSGIQIEAGDVITVKFTPYGWDDPIEFPDGKLFRVSQVQEAKIDDGSLGVKISAFEYNDTIYSDNPIQDFIAADNTGLTDPNIFNTPSIPVITNGAIANSAINYFTVASSVPTSGLTTFMDFNYGNSGNIQTHKSYSSVSVGDGTPYTAGGNVTINVADLNPGTYYWSATARNSNAGYQSESSSAFVWGGPSVTPFDPAGNVGGITYADMQPNGAGFLAYSNFDPRGALPVLVTSTSTRNIPLIFPGTSISPTDIFPWYQGTGPGSTGSWTPAIEQVQTISPEGTNGWYKAIVVDLSSDNLLSTEIGQLWATLGFLGDVNNIQYQVCRYAIFTGGGAIQLQTRTLQTYFTGFKEPYPTHISLNDWATGSPTAGGISEWGWMIRNITPGSNLTMFHGTLSVKQQKLNP